LKIQDGGNRHLENRKNCDISATVWPVFTKFGTLNFKNPRWRTAAILKPLHHPISATF